MCLNAFVLFLLIGGFLYGLWLLCQGAFESSLPDWGCRLHPVNGVIFPLPDATLGRHTLGVLSVCLVFGFVATVLTIAAWLFFWFLHVFIFFLLAAWVVFLKASCQRFAYLLFSLYFCFVAVCLTCLIEFMAALRRTYRNGQRYIIYIIHRDGWWVIHGDTSNRFI